MKYGDGGLFASESQFRSCPVIRFSLLSMLSSTIFQSNPKIQCCKGGNTTTKSVPTDTLTQPPPLPPRPSNSIRYNSMRKLPHTLTSTPPVHIFLSWVVVLVIIRSPLEFLIHFRSHKEVCFTSIGFTGHHPSPDFSHVNIFYIHEKTRYGSQ